MAFNHPIFGCLQVVAAGPDGNPWFIASQVAKTLGYAAPRNAVRDFCKGGIKTMLPSAGGPQMMTIIPEGDLYRLAARSKLLPTADQFESWVFDEVLPSIRKTGGYVHTPRPSTTTSSATSASSTTATAVIPGSSPRTCARRWGSTGPPML